ncbi:MULTISPECIES: PaaI family thioesterase [unclassified Bradyrhizobium]|uniref:PaaI family thioesterase n=1 Tax=unclassified Bradyrhizobium TaxID=2631580 RepID=UPI0028E2AE86|nr:MULTISPECIES: PaaI family thioesterase [unclassified Bradyrhizobium]
MSDHLNETPPAALLLGREIIAVDPQSGVVQLRFFADPKFANRHGTVQGGMLAAMLDSATGNAVMANLPQNQTAVTTRLDTTFVKPAALGPLTAKARVVKHDARSAIAEAELIDSSGQIVARACAELRVRERSKAV